MARCGCGSTCTCVFLDGDCIDVVGSGTVASPFRPNLVIDPNPNNEAVCGPTGLLVVTDVKILDTDCINLSGNGTTGSPISATPILSGDPDQLITCTPTGLLAQIFTVDTSCIAMAGNGTAVTPLNASPIISPDAGNTFECRANGMFTPAAAPAAASCYAQISASVAYVETAPIAAVVQLDTCDYDSGGMCNGAFYRIDIPVGCGGWYDLYAEVFISNFLGGVGVTRDEIYIVKTGNIILSQSRTDRVYEGTTVISTAGHALLPDGETVYVIIIIEADPPTPTPDQEIGSSLLRILKVLEP